MTKKNDPSIPIELDSDQLRNLEELIDSLKKDIMVVGRRNSSESSEDLPEFDGSIHAQRDALSLKPRRMFFGTKPEAIMAISAGN